MHSRHRGRGQIRAARQRGRCWRGWHIGHGNGGEVSRSIKERAVAGTRLYVVLVTLRVYSVLDGACTPLFGFCLALPFFVFCFALPTRFCSREGVYLRNS